MNTWADITLRDGTECFGRVSEVTLAGKPFLQIIDLDDQRKCVAPDLVASIDEVTETEAEYRRLHRKSIATIKACVARAFNVSVADLESNRRPNHIAIPRMVAFYVCRKVVAEQCGRLHCVFTLESVGHAFGNRDHGTVMHGERRIADLMSTGAEGELKDKVKRICGNLGLEVGTLKQD